MAKKTPTSITPDQLRELNLLQGDADLARERYAHALTRAELVKHAAEATAAKAELEAIKTREQAASMVRQARDEHSSANMRLQHLTVNIRRDHNLSEQHAIDAQTGAIQAPEG